MKNKTATFGKPPSSFWKAGHTPTLFAAFLFGGLWLNRNFFKYVFEKTFHYTEEGWNKFTWNFAWFFVFTAFANEAVRLTFKDERVYDFLGLHMDGVAIWIALITPKWAIPPMSPAKIMSIHAVPLGGVQ